VVSATGRIHTSLLIKESIRGEVYRTLANTIDFPICMLFLDGSKSSGFEVPWLTNIIILLKVGTNENGSACGRWLSIGI
jgi:hypothetical protein